jgi:hypothetical protein
LIVPGPHRGPLVPLFQPKRVRELDGTEWEPSNDPPLGVIPESSACEAVRGLHPRGGRQGVRRIFATRRCQLWTRGWGLRSWWF